jgi:hypothetical protein
MTLLGPAAASAAADPGPAPHADVTVAVLGGSTPADEHAAIDYTIEVRDAGSVPYRHVAVTALIPAGFHILHASPPSSGAVPGGAPVWTVDLVPGHPLEIRAELVAGTVHDLAEAPAPLVGPSDVISGPDLGSASMAWYSLTACARSDPVSVPVCGQSSQLLVKTDDDTRRGIEAIVLILGVPLIVAGLCIYAWRIRRESEAD